jgi:PAS domain-containing protein
MDTDNGYQLLEELRRALAGSERRLAVILDAVAEAVTIRGPDNHLVYANRAALDRLGFASAEDLGAGRPAGADGAV